MSPVDDLREAARLLRNAEFVDGEWVLALAAAFEVAVAEFCEDEDTGMVWADCPSAGDLANIAAVYLGRERDGVP